MRIDEDARGEHSILTLSGMFTAGDASAVLADALSRSETARSGAIVLDVSNVGHVDSTALGVLVGSMRRLHADAREMRLVGAGPRLRLLLELTQLDSMFPMHATVPDAIAAEHSKPTNERGGRALGDRDRHDV